MINSSSSGRPQGMVAENPMPQIRSAAAAARAARIASVAVAGGRRMVAVFYAQLRDVTLR